MATKKSDPAKDPHYVGTATEQVEEAERRRVEATTVDGSETPLGASASVDPDESS